jgi:hypothetical protein
MDFSDYYKRALKALGMTNRDFAQLLTSVRHDGQSTSQATVSRWMTGATPIDAGVLLYFTDRLRQLAGKSVRRPAKPTVIGVGGGKGGTGGSILAVGLALTSHDCGYRTMHMSSHDRWCNNQLALSVLPATIERAGPEMAADGCLSEYDFVFVDVYRDLVRDCASEGAAEARNVLEAIDIFVTPLDAASATDVRAIADMYSSLDVMKCDERMLVHFSSTLNLFGFETFFERMDQWSHMLHENAIPRLSDGPFAQPATISFQEPPNAGFLTQDIRQRYWQLFSKILARAGVDAEENVDVEALDFFGLVDLLVPGSTISAASRGR